MSGSGDPADSPNLPATVPLRAEIEGILAEELVAPQKRERVAERVTEVVLRSESYEGYVTHPRIAGEWERIVPGAAREILDLDKKQIEHHIRCEGDVLAGIRKYGTRGQYIGGTLIVLPLIAAFYLAVTGHSWEIVSLFLAPPVIGGAVAFVNRQVQFTSGGGGGDDDNDEKKKSLVKVAD